MKREKKKEEKTPQNCKSPTSRQRFMTTIKNVTEEEGEKKLKNLIGFLSANEIDNYNSGGGNPKESTEQRKNKNNKYF